MDYLGALFIFEKPPTYLGTQGLLFWRNTIQPEFLSGINSSNFWISNNQAFHTSDSKVAVT